MHWNFRTSNTQTRDNYVTETVRVTVRGSMTILHVTQDSLRSVP